MTSAPYADAAFDYQRGGWSPIPLPPGRKKAPPAGWTGYDAPMVSGADVAEWASNGHAAGNVGLRLPETVIGLDLDSYDGKPGLATMLEAVERLGPLPKTVCSTSRDDGVSGIRFYRVPPGRRWADILGPGVEVIHWGHRYAVAAPSLHPEGRPYRWLGPDGQSLAEMPAVDALPELPPVWVAELDQGDATDRTPKALLVDGDVAAYLHEFPQGEACQYVTRLLDEAAAALAGAATRHDIARGYVIRIVRAGEQGHHGATAALDTLEALWLDSLRRGKARPADPGEWLRMVTGAVAMTTATPTAELDKGCCGIVPLSLVPDSAPADGLDTTQQVDRAYEQAAAFAREVETEAHRIRIREAARAKVATENAVEAPPFDAGLLTDVLARPAEPPDRVAGLIPSEAGTLIVAQRKLGKTTLQLGLARSLIVGGDFLGRFGVRPISGRVGLLNFEVSAAQIARWAHEAGVPPDRLFLVNLRGRRNPFGNETDRDELAAELRRQQVESLFVDPFGRAFVGKSQNDPGEVGGWLGELDRFARGDCGVTDVVLSAHAGWDGERTRGASALEDWADSIVTLVRGRDDDRLRYLRAEGRDVLVDEDRLDYDHATRTLSLAGTGSRKASASTRHLEELLPAVVEVVKAEPGITGYRLDAVLRGAGEAFHKGDGAKAARLGVDRGQLRIKDGKRNSKCFYPLTSPTSPPPPRGDIPPPPPPPYIRGGGEVGGQHGSPPPALTIPSDPYTDPAEDDGEGDTTETDDPTPNSHCPSCLHQTVGPPGRTCDTPDLHPSGVLL